MAYPLPQLPFPHVPFPPAPFPVAPFPLLPAPMLPFQHTQVPTGQRNNFPHPGNPQPHPGYAVLPQPMQVQQPVPYPYYSQYVAVPLPPMFQPIYQPPVQHFGGPLPPFATERWSYDLPETNAQRAVATEYPVRAQTPHPPHYLPRNGSGFEYAEMAAETPVRGEREFVPGSANRATTGSPRERGRVVGGPFESAHSYNFGRQ